jgi:hypothetical protein
MAGGQRSAAQARPKGSWSFMISGLVFQLGHGLFSQVFDTVAVDACSQLGPLPAYTSVDGGPELWVSYAVPVGYQSPTSCSSGQPLTVASTDMRGLSLRHSCYWLQLSYTPAPLGALGVPSVLG